VTADPKDEFLVALARAANVVALVSGDPHLTDLVNRQPPVMTPAAFLNHLRA
jgi:predicted nucleic acid-binding protein